jgi:hypothetical protein
MRISILPLQQIHEQNVNTVEAPSHPMGLAIGPNLQLEWTSLKNVEYLTEGGNSLIQTAVLNGNPVVVKTLKPKCQDLPFAVNEIEDELGKISSS